MMSNIQTVMIFEYLPNEILLECFEYLTHLDIFYSFDQLNYRFNKLIRNIFLHVDFQHVPRSIFEKFCRKMLSNEEMKKQIYSLHLSNKNTCYPIRSFLSIFSFNTFVHLRSLTLTKLTESNISNLKMILPFMFQLSCFRLIDSTDRQHEILSALPISPLQTLMIPILPSNLNIFYSLINLTIFECDFVRLFQIFNNVSRLTYLNIENLINNIDKLTNKDIYLPNLKYLIMMHIGIDFDKLEMILKQTPNLTNLTISACNVITMIDVNRWEHLISSSLRHLQIFKFKFEYTLENQNDDMKEKFQEFQNDFWQNQHQWYIEYSISKDLALIYTIPYIFDSYELSSDAKRYCNESMNNVNKFDCVKSLTISFNGITENCYYYFSQVTSLKLRQSRSSPVDHSLKIQHVKYLKTIVNLSNIIHLTISRPFKFQKSAVLIEILKEAPQISSLNIDPDDLVLLFNNHRLCKDLNKMIKTLDIRINRKNSLNNSYRVKQFCEVFSRIKQLTCTINERDSLVFLLEHLAELSFINVYSRPWFFRNYMSWLEVELQKSDINIITEFSDNSYTNLSIWIIRNMH